MARRTIVVIEDDAAIRRGVVDALSAHGYTVHHAGDGDAGLTLALRAECDLVLLDLVLPGIQGLDVLSELRASLPTLPVIVLTALGDEPDRVAGLERGADDYVVKPFSVKELLARVEAVLRRSPGRPSDVSTIEFPGGTVDLESAEIVFADGRETETLAQREAELLRYLAQSAGRVISREELLSRVWRIDTTGLTTRTVDVHIGRLREKLGDPDGELIATVRGKGYRFTADAAPHASPPKPQASQ